uniref:YihY family inner membrane protein n=1 Tax=uncultured Acinetobacter sp. TaxID=165433 RepID=UPI00262C9006|nr:YihY family inner membrane protein [uncultured Acinetobacter sp.]
MLDKLKASGILEKKWIQFIRFVLYRFEADRCRESAGSLTYTTLFAIVPMLTVFLVIVSSIKALEPARQQMQTWIYSNFLPKTSIAFDKALNAFTENSSNLTIIGILFLFFTTVMMLSSIELAFNRIWRVRQARGGIVGFMRYWTIISLGPIILGTAFVLSSTVASMNLLSNTVAGYQFDFAYVLLFISFTLTCLGFSLLYWTIPNRSVPIKSAVIAGIFSGVVFELLKNLFGFIMSNFTSYQLVYGAFAALPIFLLWIYTSWLVVLLGVEISYAITAFHSDKTTKRHPILMLLDVLELFHQKQKRGGTVSDREAMNILGRGEIGKWPYFIELLEKQNLITRTDSNEYVLIRNLEQVDLWQFVKNLPYALPHRSELNDSTPNDHVMQVVGSTLAESDAYLAQKLAIPLATIFDSKNTLEDTV